MKNQFSNFPGESFSLPPSLPGVCRSLSGGRRAADRYNRVRRSTQIVGCHVCNRRGSPGRESGELRRVG